MTNGDMHESLEEESLGKISRHWKMPLSDVPTKPVAKKVMPRTSNEGKTKTPGKAMNMAFRFFFFFLGPQKQNFRRP